MPRTRRELQREGRTILFVTHAADLVRTICDRAVVLDHGKMVTDAPPGEAVRMFREHLLQGEGETGDAPRRRSPAQTARTARRRRSTARADWLAVHGSPTSRSSYPGLVDGRNGCCPTKR